VTVTFPTTGTPFAVAPLVTVTVQGSIPYAVAVAAETTQFVVTLTAVQNTAPATSSVVLNWIAVANS
jgi:hypothetical protein